MSDPETYPRAGGGPESGAAGPAPSRGYAKRFFLIVLAVLTLAVIGFLALGPGITERGMNKVTGQGLLTVSPQAKQLHASLAVADLHADTLLWKRDMLERAERGQVDLPRLQAGNVALQVFSSVTKTPTGQNYDANGADSDNITLLAVAQAQPVRTWTSLLERSLWHAEKLERAAAKSGGKMIVVRTADDLRRVMGDRQRWIGDPPENYKPGPHGTGIMRNAPVGALLSIEGMQNIEGKAANVDVLFDAGFRMAGLTHFFDNELGGSMHGLKKGGITPLGAEVVRAMEAKGMIVDVAHASHALVADILRMAKRPVVSSHGGVQATCKVNRNLTDGEIRGIARTGGVVGIGYWDGAVCATSLRAVAAAIAHVRDLVGIAHVGLGSDFDGAVTTAFDTAQLVQVTQALIERGFSETEIRAVMGGNVLRVLAQGLPREEEAL